MEEGRKMHFIHIQLLSLSLGGRAPPLPWHLDGKRKHENEMGETLGIILHNQKKATRPPQLPCCSHLGGVADLSLTTLWQPAIHEHEDTQRPARESRPCTHAVY